MNGEVLGTVDHLIFIHGRNTRLGDDRWLEDGLEPLFELLDLEPPRRCGVRIEQPHYTELIDAAPPPQEYPPILDRQGTASPSAESRAAYEARLERMRAVRGSRPAAGTAGAIHGRFPADVAASAVIKPQMPDVYRYITRDSTRRAVQSRLWTQLPTTGSAVLIAHSLGTVVALDFLHFLPPELRIRCLITLGSPLGLKAVRKELTGSGYNWPYDHVEAWINLFDPADRVTAGRPLEPVFVGEVLDVQVDNHTKQTHSGSRYLSHGALVRMVGEHLGRSQAEEPPGDLDPRVVQAVLVRALGRRIEAETPPGSKRRTRMAKAREITEDLLLSEAREHEPDLQTLMFDLASIGKLLPSRAARLANLAVLYVANPFDPFDVEYRGHELREGTRALGLAIGVSSEEVNVLFRSIDEAESVFEDKRAWKKFAIGAGAAALVIAAPFAVVALGAVGGLAGAAAIASGLSAVGGAVGGGMVAGIGLVGTVTASGAATATVAVSQMKQEVLEAELVRTVALCRCEQLLGIGSEGADGLRGLIAVRKGVETLRDQQKHVCGSKSPAVGSLEHRLEALAKAIAWLRAKGIGDDDEPEVESPDS